MKIKMSIWAFAPLIISSFAFADYSNSGIFLDHASTVARGGIGNLSYNQQPGSDQAAGQMGSPPSAVIEIEKQGPLHFAFNSVELQRTQRDDLQNIAQILKDNPTQKVEIVGFADATGPDQYNQKLSEERADQVKMILIKDGVASNQIQTRGQGKEDPVASNSEYDGRAQNRRAEIHALG